MLKTPWLNHRLALGVILVTATFLRLYHLHFSFSNDELSALSRLDFNHLGPLFREGIRVDGHPAFTQLLLWFWTALTGTTHEWLVRIPFALMGTGAVYFTYLTGREWFGKNAGLAAAAALTGLQFFILYSQLARPYSPGLFFTMGTAFYWSRLVVGSRRNSDVWIGALFATLAMYTHYFSFLQVVVMAFLGLFMLKKRSASRYLLALVIAVALWLPHVPITLYQLTLEGVGSWLSAPEPGFAKGLLTRITNESWWLLLALILAAATGWGASHRSIAPSRWQLIALLLVVIPFLVGYFYSIWKFPVLQYAVMLFAAPFLILLIFSPLAGQQNTVSGPLISMLVLGITTGHTVWIHEHYNRNHFGVFRELTEHMSRWQLQYGAENTLALANVVSPWYIQHYAQQMDPPPRFDLYNLSADTSRQALWAKVVDADAYNYVALCWSNHSMSEDVLEMIRINYPQMIERHDYFNSGAYLFGKKRNESGRWPLLDSVLVSTVQVMPDTLPGSPPNLGVVLAENEQFSKPIELNLNNLKQSPPELAVLDTYFYTSDTSRVTLVIEYEDEASNSFWYGRDLDPVYRMPGALQRMVIGHRLPTSQGANPRIKAYLWKQSPDSLEIIWMQLQLHHEAILPY